MQNRYTVKALEEKIGYRFQDIDLLQQAITHTSFTNEMRIKKSGNYERLEFLGDAVLEMVSSAYLYREHEEMTEGELTKLRASLVCEPALAFCARKLKLGKFVRLGRGEEGTGGRYRDSITSDVMEAVIGAIFLDGGIDSAEEFIHRFILNDLENKRLFYDSKTSLQEIIQGKMKKDFRYHLLGEKGPEHDKSFSVEVIFDKQRIGIGSGRTKKAAEQQAAYQALMYLRDKGVQ